MGSLWIEGTGPFDTAASMAGKRIGVVKGSYPETARTYEATIIVDYFLLFLGLMYGGGHCPVRRLESMISISAANRSGRISTR